MTLPQVISRTNITKITTSPINVRKVNESPAEFYTCPTGKKALISGTCLCTGLGAATEVRLLAGGVSALRFVAADVTGLISKAFSISLDAADTLAKGQNSGTNGELDLNCTVQETPA